MPGKFPFPAAGLRLAGGLISREVQASSVEIGGQILEVLHLPGSSPDRPTLLLLHEGLGSIGLWRDLPQRLRERTGCGIFVYSRHGNGFSSALEGPRAPDYMHREALEVLPALLESAGIERPIVIGHSDGGSIALIFAGSHPQRARALVLLAPHVFVEEIAVRSIAAIGVAYRAGALRERLAHHHRDVDRTFYGWHDIWLSPSFRDWNIEEYLSRVAAPVAIVQGRQDEYGTLAQLDAIEHELRAPCDRVVLDRCGHSPHRDRPAAVESLIAAMASDLQADPRRSRAE